VENEPAEKQDQQNETKQFKKQIERIGKRFTNRSRAWNAQLEIR